MDYNVICVKRTVKRLSQRKKTRECGKKLRTYNYMSNALFSVVSFFSIFLFVAAACCSCCCCYKLVFSLEREEKEWEQKSGMCADELFLMKKRNVNRRQTVRTQISADNVNKNWQLDSARLNYVRENSFIDMSWTRKKWKEIKWTTIFTWMPIIYFISNGNSDEAAFKGSEEHTIIIQTECQYFVIIFRLQKISAHIYNVGNGFLILTIVWHFNSVIKMNREELNKKCNRL